MNEGEKPKLDSNPHKNVVLVVETMREEVEKKFKTLNIRDKDYIKYKDAQASLVLLMDGLLNGSVSQEQVLERIEQIKRDLWL